MKILITGSSGFVGKHLFRGLAESHDVIGADKNKSDWTQITLDITKKDEVMTTIQKIKPEVVIHAAALPSVDYCETHREEAHAINVEGTRHLVQSLPEKDIFFIYLSSDYVYDGVKGNFTEEDLPNPISWYGQNKLDAEEIVKQLPRHLILRPTVIFGWDPGGKNFFMQLYENQKTGMQMKVPKDQISNPTYIHLLAEMVGKGIAKSLKGTFIATGPETLSRYDFALKICETFGFDKSLITPVRTSDLGQAAKRPLNCGTDSGKIQKALGMTFPSLKETLLNLKSVTPQ